MSKKIIIFPLGFIVQTNPMNSLRAFLKEGISLLKVLWYWFALPSFLERFRGPSIASMIERYRRGTITSAQFQTELGEIFPQIKTSPHFVHNWCVQCVVSEFTRKGLGELFALENKAEVYVLGGTNPLHMDYIQAQCGPLPGKLFLSYEQNALEDKLLRQLLAKIQREHPNIPKKNVVLFYKNPEKPTHDVKGITGFLLNIISNWFNRKAIRYVKALEQEASRSGRFELLAFAPKDNEPRIHAELVQSGFLAKRRQREMPLITPRRSLRLVEQKQKTLLLAPKKPLRDPDEDLIDPHLRAKKKLFR